MFSFGGRQVMQNKSKFERISAIAAIVSAPLALGASIVLAQALQFNPELMSNPASLIALGPQVAATFRWAEFIGLFGYYLLLLPATIYLWYWLKKRDPGLVGLFSILGLAYIFVGALGSAVLVSVAPPLMVLYPQALESQRNVLQAVFQVVTDLGIVALFSLSYILGGIWWLGIGSVLRAERRILGMLTVLQGVVTLVYGAGLMLQIQALTNLEAFTFFAPIWALWLGVVIWRNHPQAEMI
jgi:hypothetical protein